MIKAKFKFCRDLIVCICCSTKLNISLICLVSLIFLKPSQSSLVRMNESSEDPNLPCDNLNIDEIDDFSLEDQVALTNDDPNVSERSINNLGHESALDIIIHYEPHNVFSNRCEASSSDCLDVKMQLQCRIKKKMRAEGKEVTSENYSATKANDNKLTPEEMQKRNDKQERNKEAARKSRRKKKEEEQKLHEDHAKLETENQELKDDVSNLKSFNKKCKNFLGSHFCMISNGFPHQDHVDDHSEETCRKQVYVDLVSDQCGETDQNHIYGWNEQAHKAVIWNETDDKYIEVILDDLNDLKVSYRPQQESQLVTSGTYYETHNTSLNPGYNIGIQENILPDSCSEIITKPIPKVSSEIIGNSSEIVSLNNKKITSEDRGHSSIIPMLTTEMNHIVKGNSSSLRGLQYYPWATNTDSQSEEKEAFEEINALQPPPEKRPRLE